MAHRIFSISLAKVYQLYIAKAESKGRSRAEVDEVICWLTGQSEKSLANVLAAGTGLEAFYASALRLNPARALIAGVVCGVRVEQVEDPVMREILYLDKLSDEVARGKAMEKICAKSRRGLEVSCVGKWLTD